MAVDLGTSFIKAGVYDISGKCLSQAREPVRSERPAPDQFIQRGADIYRSVLRSMRTAAERSGGGSGVEAVAFTGQMAGFMGVGADWEDVTGWSCSLDTRYTPFAQRQMAEHGEAFLNISGTNSPLFSSKYEWFRHDFPAEAARIREEAKAAFEEERKRGFEKGLQDGKLEIAMQKLEQVDQSVAFMESVEGKMADIVMKALKSCVVEIGDREMVINIVRKTMNAVIRTQRHVTLKVAPEMVAAVKERVSALRVDYPTVETFDVVEDPRLKGPACILETEAGVADASVETQLAAIERSLKRHIAGGREEAAKP